MKVLFLDFDGVLNGRAFLDTLPRTITLQARPDIDPACAARVQRICDVTGASIVVTSSWREMRAHDGKPDTCHAPRDLSTLAGWLTDAGITAPVIGATSIAPMGVDDNPGRRRSWQILAWTFDHPEVTRWVALDDLEMPPSDLWEHRFIRTDGNTGVTEADADRAIELLGVSREALSSARLVVVPVTLREANAFVDEHHRHHRAPQGALFAIGASVDVEPLSVCAVAIVGRPVARHLDDGWTAEVVRLASDGTRNACSILYAACWRAAKALGYRKLVTYTLAEEGGASLRAAGWHVVAEQTGGGSWSRRARPRVDTHPLQAKIRWEAS